MRCLTSLGIRIPLDLRLGCIDVKQKYPVAVKLKEAVSIFTRTCREVDRALVRVSGGGDAGAAGAAPATMMTDLSKLIDDYKYDVQQQLLRGVGFRW